jgi:hypothetical protein
MCRKTDSLQKIRIYESNNKVKCEGAAERKRTDYDWLIYRFPSDRTRCSVAPGNINITLLFTHMFAANV